MMFSRIRKRLTYANVAMTLALVFAMTGGAYAASKYVITSTKQISPKVLKTLTGKAGKNGANGANGPVGAQGAQGPQGAAGAKGETGAAGAPGGEGKAGNNGEPGKEGSPWTAGGTLPSGKTERGVWSVLYTATAAGQIMSAPISYNVPLATSPHATLLENFIGPKEGEGEENEKKTAIPSHCKGTVAEPQAIPGNLCVFVRTSVNATPHLPIGELFFDPQGGAAEPTDGAGPAGAVMGFTAVAAGTVFEDGVWAVTAE